MNSPKIYLTFHGTTRDLLRRPIVEDRTFVYPLTRRASIKDIIEALGVPHTEVGRILLGACPRMPFFPNSSLFRKNNARNIKNMTVLIFPKTPRLEKKGLFSDRLLGAAEQTFTFIPKGGEEIHIYPQSAEIAVTEATVLRPDPVPEMKFMVDNTVGKLARLMRMAGLDVSSAQEGSLRDIATTAAEQKRIMLTRNTDLLKHRMVLFGHLIRNQQPELQLAEVIKLYNLALNLEPFSRCLICNNTLVSVAKEMILAQLQPLTKKYYSQFKQCKGCKRVYWRGSHYKRMEQVVNRLTEFK